MAEITDWANAHADDVTGVTIKLMSPERVKELAHGEVTSHECIKYKTAKPVVGGLFCERIFGPIKDYACACGKIKTKSKAESICSSCGVEITSSSVRRERLGYVALAAPVAHIWYVKSTIPKLLGVKVKSVVDVINFDAYMVTNPGVNTPLEKYQVLTYTEYQDCVEKYDDDFSAETGAQALYTVLKEMDLDALEKELCDEIKKWTAKSRLEPLNKRLDLVRKFKKAGNRPEWMILINLPVLPPDLRPMSEMKSGNFATSDLNELYRTVITRNNRLKDIMKVGAPEVILNDMRRALQEAVNCLLDNDSVARPITDKNRRPLKSLSKGISGKQGRFRQNLLGKRVDYSGRSVICVEPKLQMWQCGLPKNLALELYKTFVMGYLIAHDAGGDLTKKAAKNMIQRKDARVYDALEKVMEEHPVFLNRAPTLHRLGIQAFQPILVEGNAIKLHPLVCTAFNADFDGDQMGVHLPLSHEAQAEARFLMLSTNNLLKPSDGKPVVTPSQDMVLGAYYLTMVEENAQGAGGVYATEDEAEMAYSTGVLNLHAPIKVRRTLNGKTTIVDTTIGKIIFNKGIPQNLGFVDRTDESHACDYEVDFLVKKSDLGKIIEKCIFNIGSDEAALLLDHIKTIGYKYSTKAGVTVSAADAVIPDVKASIVVDAEKRSERLTDLYNRGFMTSAEKSRFFIRLWNNATDEVTKAVEAGFDAVNNPIHMMADSGARGSMAQLRQLVGMRGLIANTAGKTIEMPIKSNYREGLTGLEYFIAARGARKGFVDTAMRTADSGYLTRRLVTIAQDIVVTEADCGCDHGIVIQDIYDDSGNVLETFEERVVGRYLVKPFVFQGVEIWGTDKPITHSGAEEIAKYTKRIEVRSVLTCNTENGVCCKCYGIHLATNRPIELGDAIGVISAQSIGEPGTQLTMRTFHTGGIASGDDITQGLPRVEEIFENRPPKKAGRLSPIDGTAQFRGNDLFIVPKDIKGRAVKIEFTYKPRYTVTDGQAVKKGDRLAVGAIQPSEMLECRGLTALYDYLVTEVQKVYRIQGVDINDKHIEVIARQMLAKVLITNSKTNKFTNGTIKTKAIVDKYNQKATEPIEYKPLLIGITKMSKASDSFLSAAAFQESKSALTTAAINGSIDRLKGLNENVMIGKLIPAGTGLAVYKNTQVVKAEEGIKYYADPDEINK